MESNVNRRKFLNISTLALGATALTGLITHPLKAEDQLQEYQPAPLELTPDEALDLLMQGNKRFIKNKRENPNQTLTRLTETAKGQFPFVALLSCADSRIPVEIIFDRGLGDLFVVRNAGNIATPEVFGSLEFGTLVLNAKVLMVIGHDQCGAVKAAIQGGEFPGKIGSIVEQIAPAVETAKDQDGDQLENTIKANVMLQIERLKQSPVLSQLIAENKLKIVGSRYDLDRGEITLYS
jgi:carbonic anhydrase